MILLNQIKSCVNSSRIVNEANVQILNVLQITDPNFNANSLAWCSDKNAVLLNEIVAGFVIVSSKLLESIDPNDYKHLCFVVVDNPRQAFAKVLNEFFVKHISFGKIASSAFVDESVMFDNNAVNIGHNVVIEENCVLGNNVVIGHNTVIKSGTIIQDFVSIGSNCTIGGVGFGYEANEQGDYELIPHIGNVVLGKHVEVGNNVCIDRAVLGSTILQDNVKVDNLVHIAHGVDIGKNSLIIANAMIAGSVKIGQNCWIAPSSSIKQKLVVGSSSTVGMGSVVLKDVDENAVVAGVPAKKLN